MRFDLRFTTRPIEDLWCQAVVMLSFKIQGRMSSTLERINKKMAGSIESFTRSGIWSGECNEKLLFATQNSIKADKLLLHGLGEESIYSLNILKKEITDVGMSLNKMGVNEFGIFIPHAPGLESEYIIHIETAIEDLAGIYLSKYKDAPDYTLKMYISIENRYMEPAEKMTERLRDHFSPLSDFSIILDKSSKHQGISISGLAA